MPTPSRAPAMQPEHSTAVLKAATSNNAGEVPATLSSFNSLPDSAHVNIDVVCGIFGCGRSTVWYRVKHGKLPAPRKFCGSTRWKVGDLRAALEVTA